MGAIDYIAYGLLPWYPHMGADDAQVWERYIRANAAAWDRAAYDVAVGEGAPFDVTAGGVLGAGIGRIYQRRIDVIAARGSQRAIIEVKRYATTAALGQIEGYGLIAARDYPELAAAELIVIAESFAPEMDFLARAKKITLIRV